MLVLPQAKALALKLNNPERVLASIPTAQRLNVRGHEIVVTPHKVEEVEALNNLGIGAPSPILYHYNWPGRFKPYQHQQDTAAFLTINRKGLVLNEIGCGKTASALWAADYLIETGAVGKVLIISPLSTLERVWGDAVYMGLPNRRATVLHGSAERRKKLLRQNADFYIVNHDGFPIIAPEAHGMFDLVIVDEAAVLRNPTTKRFKTFRRWLDKEPKMRLWLMTGTPTPNEPTDAWALAKLIDSPFCTKTYTSFRDQVMQKIGMYKYIPRPDAPEIVKHILQPSIRFTRDECFDLPDTVLQTREVPLTPDQAHHYKQMMKHLLTETGGADGTITAVNEAVKMMKLIQIACIARGTQVLCSRGWVPIEAVTSSDTVWDGQEWVSQGGAIYRGRKATITLAGVRLTADHKVLTNNGWARAGDILHAKPCSGLNRQAVRLPVSDTPRWDFTKQMRSMGMRMRLWGKSDTGKPVPTNTASYPSAELWLHTRQSNSRHDEHPPISNMDTHETAVLGPQVQGLPPLGWPWHFNMPEVAGGFRKLLGRYAGWLRQQFIAWSYRQQRELHTRKLPVGNPEATSSQSQEEVYDLVNCGPRNRFVVRGATGELTIVHNCGVAYGEDGNYIELDCAPRVNAVKEVIEEAGGKVILFVPLTGTLKMLERELSKQWTVASVNGEVSSSKRDEIFYNFQHASDPRILIAHPATMAHGLTLTAASTVIWYGPIASNEQYTQANGRVERIGKRHVSNVVHIQSTLLEQKVFERLAGKQKMQGILLDLIQQEMRR
jgi:superfamily II DNA or RNA helicase